MIVDEWDDGLKTTEMFEKNNGNNKFYKQVTHMDACEHGNPYDPYIYNCAVDDIVGQITKMAVYEHGPPYQCVSPNKQIFTVKQETRNENEV